MTAASTRRHKRRVAPGSGQNKCRRTAQRTQSHKTGNSSSGGGPNDVEHTPSQPDRSQQEGSTPTGRFGKTFNLSTIEEFLKVVNSSDAYPVDGHIDVQARHQARERLFDGTMLKDRSSALKIPDGEHRRAWDDMLLTAIFDNDSGNAWANERKSMLDKLYACDMHDIHQQSNHVLQRLSNASRTMYEVTSADIFHTFILLKMMLPLPQDDMDDYSGGNEMGPISINEEQSGDGCFDWRAAFPRGGPHRPKPLCVTFEFKRIRSASNQTFNHPFRMAQEGLEQIIDRRYAADISHAHRRLDVGVAIGMGTVATRQRMWRPVSEEERRARAQPRQNVRYADTDGGTTVEEWDQQHIGSDNTGWLDEHGWITERISDEFRV
ncbi:hypothetical protein GQ54DRAFT_314409 [Martensiomyces pterosporus]|nr:hypothetical protein GQ54DRAFT_314409 [Martensiomyces pterosporus]